MFKRVLFATDFSESNLRILNCFPEFKRIGVLEFLILRVINLSRFVGVSGIDIEGYIRVHEEEANVRLREIAEKIEKMGFKAKPIFPVPVGDPVSEILRISKEYRADLIVMGSRGRGIIKAILLGSTAEGVVRRSEIPVMVFKREGKKFFDRILYAHDLSENAQKIMKYVKFIADRVGSEILLVHVIERGEVFKEDEFEYIKRELEGFKVKTIIGYGTPHKEILKISKEENATSIFIGSTGVGSKSLLGSTADMVIRHSDIPVFISKT